MQTQGAIQLAPLEVCHIPSQASSALGSPVCEQLFAFCGLWGNMWTPTTASTVPEVWLFFQVIRQVGECIDFTGKNGGPSRT